MGNRIPDEIVDQVQKSADIVEVIGDYVQLKKQGRNYFGLCPFHGESTPSFSVSPDKQIFHCFGCGAGGNVFSFLRQMEGYSFAESVSHLADKYQIDFPCSTQGGEQRSIQEPSTQRHSAVRAKGLQSLCKPIFP